MNDELTLISQSDTPLNTRTPPRFETVHLDYLQHVMLHPEQFAWFVQSASAGADELLPAAAMANVATIASVTIRVRIGTHLLSRYDVEIPFTGLTDKHTPPLLRRNGLRSVDQRSQIRREEMNIGMSRAVGGLLVGMQEIEESDPAVAGEWGTTMSICNGGCSPM
jgi:hypothetical protein